MPVAKKTPARKAPAKKAAPAKPAARRTPAKKATDAPKLKGGTMGTMKAVKIASKKGGGDSTWLKRITEEGITVRFLTDPDAWFGYMRYWDNDAQTYVPMLDGEVAPKGSRTQFRFVGNAVEIDGSTTKVVALDIPKSLSASLIVFYDKYGSIVDRDYELIATGEGIDITYQLIPDSPRKRAVTKFELIDLEEFLLKMREEAMAKIEGSVALDGDEDEDEDDEEEEDDEEVEDEEEEEDDEESEEEEEDEDEEESDDEMSWEDLGAAADGGDAEAVAALTEAAEEAEVEPDNYPTWAELAEFLGSDDEDESEDEEEEAEDEEEEDESDEDELTEEDLEAMSVKELRALAEEFEVEFAGLKKAALIEAILEAAGEE